MVASQEPPKRSKPAAAAPVLDDAEDLELVRCLAQTQRPDASGAHARDDDDAAAAAGAEGDEAEAARLRQMRAEVLAAFQRDEDEETSEDDDEVVATPVEKRSARRRRQQEGACPPERCARIHSCLRSAPSPQGSVNRVRLSSLSCS